MPVGFATRLRATLATTKWVANHRHPAQPDPILGSVELPATYPQTQLAFRRYRLRLPCCENILQIEQRHCIRQEITLATPTSARSLGSRPHALYFAVAVLLTSCGGGDPAPPTPSLRSAASIPAATILPATPAPPPIEIILLGETARGDTGEITIHGVRRSTREGDEFAPTGFEWLLLDVALKHLGTEPHSFEVVLVHADGREFERARPPGISLELDAPVAAGAGVRGEIAYLVEVSMRGGILVYGFGDDVWALQLGLLPRQ